ncbi:MAG: hypothetical protein ACXW5U_07510 [Thermoanaerobaculia bacterium]
MVLVFVALVAAGELVTARKQGVLRAANAVSPAAQSTAAAPVQQVEENSRDIGLFASILRALSRARWAIGSIALMYALVLLTGMAAVHLGHPGALQYRDRIVARGQSRDPAGIARQAGTPVRAAFLDFGRNLLLGAVPDTVSGMAVVLPYVFAVHRGWVGGIVSVTRSRTSRLASWPQALYYLSVVLLQLLPYSLAGGMGVHLGLSMWHPQPYYAGPRWLGALPPEAVFDVLRVYCVIPPLFLAASLWEYLSPWNV